MRGFVMRSAGIWFVLALCLLGPGLAWADKSAEEVCKDVAAKAGRTLWSSMRESGDELYCRKSWVPGAPDELAACGLWTQGHLFGNKLKNLWNRIFADAEWATWGARGIGVDWEEGQINAGFKRTFFGAGLAYSTSTIEVVKEGGSAAATVTACALDYDGRVTAQQQRSFAGGKGGEGASVKIEMQHKDNRILAVVVDTSNPIPGVTFEYRARACSQPTRGKFPEVKGIADLHVHQMVNLAFGGRMYWGHHSGPAETALAKEEISPTGTGMDLTSLDGLLKTLAQPGVSIDANVVFTIAGGKVSDEGFWKYGGEGFPSFRDWPHHADRSHQQVHLSWLKEAHERNAASGSNLKLVVVSLVNNNILCSVAKLLDPHGNVPIWGPGGKIIGWESKNWGCSDHENVMRQLTAMHEIEKENKWYRIAMNPWHARQIIDDGDLAVIVSMETDKPLSSEGGNYGNWEHQLDFYRAMGLSTMQIVHESDSIFCGAAPHRDMMGALQMIHWPLQSIDNLFTTKYEVDAQNYNKRGLTDTGEKLIDAMMKRNMPIDLAHSSQRCRKGVMEQVGTNYALYDSHTKFGRLLAGHVLEREQEFLVMESILPDYKKHKVLVGLRTASVDIQDAPGTKVANNCPGSARSFAQLVQYASQQGLAFAYGTDFNTGVSQLGPRFGDDGVRCWAGRQDLKDTIPPGRTSKSEGAMPARARTIQPIAGTNYYTAGLATIGWLPELTVDLVENLRTPGAEKLRDSAEAYLDMWERAYPPASAPPCAAGGGPGGGTVALGGACTAGDQCKSGHCTGVAGAKGVCVCNEDTDCAKGQYCNVGAAGIGTNVCKPRLADGQACTKDHQCANLECSEWRPQDGQVSGICYTPSSKLGGESCRIDLECKVGKCNSNKVCVCKSDGDCKSGYWCDGGLVDIDNNVCKRKLAEGENCGVGVDIGHRCLSGKCTLGKCK